MGKSLMLLAFVALFAACTADRTPTPTPTPDMQATVDAAVAKALAEPSQPTPTPTAIQTVSATATPAPTTTPSPLNGGASMAEFTPTEPSCLLDTTQKIFDFSGPLENDFDYYVERADFERGDPAKERFEIAPVSEVVTKASGDRTYMEISRNGELVYMKPVLTEASCYEDIRLDISFRATPLKEGGQYTDGCRTLMSTNGSRPNYLGLSVFICQGTEEWSETFVAFWTSNGSEVEGYQRIYENFNEFGWNTMSVQYRFGRKQPRIEITINEFLYNVLLVEEDRADPESIRRYLTGDKFGIWFGGHPHDDYTDHPADLVLDIDSFELTFGSREQDSVQLATILRALTETTSEPRQEDLVLEFLGGFNYQWDGAFGPEVLNFIQHMEKKPPLFSLRRLVGQNNLPPSQALFERGYMSLLDKVNFILKQWILDDLSATQTGPLEYQEASVFPGKVASSARRESKQVEIDADYNTDPNFFMGSQETVFRPTGRYVPPGELVSIRIPEEAIGKGLVARVGIHYADLELTHYDFTRFPRISRTFSLDKAKVLVDNPLGGALYIEIADGTDLGLVKLEIEGAVELPSYSQKDLLGSNKDLTAFKAAIARAEVPWFEIVGKSFALTYPLGMSHNYLDPEPLLDVWERALEDINIMAGRPTERFREEWISMDSQSITNAVPWPVANPSFGFFTEMEDFQLVGTADSVYDRIDAEGFWNPRHLLEVDEQYLANSDVLAFWHEWGHMQNLPTAGCQEVESNVHLLASVVYNKTLGLTIDKALRYSGFQDYDRVDAALDTMFSPSWQDDKRMCFDEWENEMRYQTRSWARLVEIAGLYGWEAVGAIHRVFYDMGTSDMDDQDTIVLGSKTLNRNLAPIFEFWGIPATSATLDSIALLPPATEFIERLQLYRANIPNARASYESTIRRLQATTGSEGRWDHYLNNYDPGLGDLMREKVDRIIASLK